MKYILILLSIFSLFYFKETNADITITFSQNYDQDISDENGVFSLKSKYKDSNDLFNNNDIEEKTVFDMDIFTRQGKTYPLKCRLFKGEEKTIISLCNFKRILESSDSVMFEKKINLKYNEHNIILEFKISSGSLNKVSYKVPFLYSADQKFDIQENQKSINLEFKYESYNEEPLAIQNSYNPAIAPLKNCQKSGKILKCDVLIEDINKISTEKSQFYLRYYHDVIGSKAFEFAGKIYIYYNNVNKEDIFLKIEKPIYNKLGDDSYITFPTNVTKLPRIKTRHFSTIISNEESSCFLIKHNELTPLYFLCSVRIGATFTITNYGGFRQNNIHYKYNFILEPGSMDATITNNNERSDTVESLYPETLDFSKVDSIKVFLYFGNPKEVKNIRFNEAGSDLQCEDKSELKICQVPKSHFNGAKTGYYFVHHKSESNGYMAHYEAFGVNYVLQNKGKMVSSSIFVLGLLSLILF